MHNDTYYITTPIYYTNASPHVGHAYATTVADIMARYRRLVGDRTFFLTGTADHGQKIVQKAAEEGLAPQELTDRNAAKFKELYANLGISYDFFIRNSDRVHHWPGAQKLWQQLVAAGDIYKASYEGLYCVGCEKFLTEKDLVDGKCPDHDRFPEHVSEENYFFRLSKYSGRIREAIQDGSIIITPAERINELLSFIDRGLEDVSFSRPASKMSWGIPVPDDPSHTMYVWCEELSNYISAIRYGRDETFFEKLWPADFHIVGKDILRFHAITWPAMLISAGLSLPKGILGHGLITSGGRKMSKTIGNVIDPFELIDQYGADAVRYYFARHISPFSDGDLTREHFKEVYNANLANGLGNLAARIMTLAEKHLEAPIERPAAVGFPEEYTNAIETFEFNLAMNYIWSKIGVLDEKITQTEPFKVVKEDPAMGRALIAELATELYLIARLLNPFMPETNQKLKEAILANKKPENLFPRKE